MSDKLKNLTSKYPKDYEPVADSLINLPDVELFAQLVEKEDFLFDFVKQNVAKRLENCCNASNYKNLVQFLKYYSPSYEEFIVSTLAKYCDDALVNNMLEIFKTGTENEKTYCAKFFSVVKNSEAVSLLNEYAFSENSALSTNCASALASVGDEQSYNKALQMLDDVDEFTRLDGVKFLVSYSNPSAINKIIDTMKKSSVSENIAGEIPYLVDVFELYNTKPEDTLYIINLIINGLGEILSLAQVFDYRLYEFFEMLLKSSINSQIAVVLLNAADKFATLTENNEYLYDETKETKQEIYDIKSLLATADIGVLYALSDNELRTDSPFVYTALDFTENEVLVRALLSSENPTIILRALEVLKQLETLTQNDKNTALTNVADANIKNIIAAI